MIKSEVALVTELAAARSLGFCRSSMSQPHIGFASMAGIDVTVIIRAAVVLSYPASVIKGTVCSNMT